MAECDCRDDCCLEIVPVTVENYTIDGAGLTLSVAAVSGTEANVTIQVDEADYFEVRCWLQDAATPVASPSPIPPTVPGVSEFNKVTDATGLATVNCQYTGVAKSWYLCATLGNGITISDPITLGV
jgi:hypothetical protein